MADEVKDGKVSPELGFDTVNFKIIFRVNLVPESQEGWQDSVFFLSAIQTIHIAKSDVRGFAAGLLPGMCLTMIIQILHRLLIGITGKTESLAEELVTVMQEFPRYVMKVRGKTENNRGAGGLFIRRQLRP